ncbi:MAG: molybdenum cofactor guanylyltransferase [Chthoniobacterales bacterium]
MSLSAVLLCGGESHRMHRDKATIEWRHQPLWERQMQTLRELQPEAIFLSARSDPDWRPSDVTLVLDVPDSRGPRAGILAVLAACVTDHLVVLAIDLPFITSSFLRSMLQRVRGGVGLVPKIGEEFEPVAAIYPRGSIDAFKRAGSSLQPLVRELVDDGLLDVLEVAASDRQLFRNINEPADLLQYA